MVFLKMETIFCFMENLPIFGIMMLQASLFKHETHLFADEVNYFLTIDNQLVNGKEN